MVRASGGPRSPTLQPVLSGSTRLEAKVEFLVAEARDEEILAELFLLYRDA